MSKRPGLHGVCLFVSLWKPLIGGKNWKEMKSKTKTKAISVCKVRLSLLQVPEGAVTSVSLERGLVAGTRERTQQKELFRLRLRVLEPNIF